MAAILEDAAGKIFYLIVSIAVILVFVAPGMPTLTGRFGNATEVGNATGIGNRTHVSNSSMSGPTSIQVQKVGAAEDQLRTWRYSLSRQFVQ